VSPTSSRLTVIVAGDEADYRWSSVRITRITRCPKS